MFPVAAATVKGGSILSARLLLNMAHRCDKCIGYGFRPDGNWPPPYETIPSYDSESMLAIAFVKGWQDYALTQVKGRKENIRCAMTVRDPFSRVVSMFMYFQAAGEYALRNVSKTLTAMSTVEERVEWMWDEIGHETMEITHEYLVDSLASGCKLVKFEGFATNFDETVKTTLEAWGVKESVRDELISFSKGLDMSSRSEQELKADHHHTSSKFPKIYKKQVQAAFRGLTRAMDLLNKQRLDLGYALE